MHRIFKIHRMFKINPKKVCPEMRGNNSKPVKDMPEKEAIEEFWKSMWENPKEHRSDTPWMEMLKREYCKEAMQKNYEIDDKVMDKLLSKMANNKCSKDLITGLWIKRILSVKEAYKGMLKDMLNRKMEPPEWLLTTKQFYSQKQTKLETHRTIDRLLFKIRSIKHTQQFWQSS